VGEPRTILVVDDEADIRDSLRDALEDEGYTVLVAANGRDALAQLPRLKPPCAIILDIIMPVMNGVDFYATMQADPRYADVPVIVSTSDASRAPSGVFIMKKPLRVDRLLSALTKLC